MTIRARASFLALLALAALAGSARAQELSLSWHRRSHGSEVGISIGRHGVSASYLRAPECPPSAGTWEIVEEKVWVPLHESRVWCPPQYDTWYDHCGKAHRRLVSPGHWKTVHSPGHWEIQRRKVWVPNYRPSSAIVRRWR